MIEITIYGEETLTETRDLPKMSVHFIRLHVTVESFDKI